MGMAPTRDRQSRCVDITTGTRAALVPSLATRRLTAEQRGRAQVRAKYMALEPSKNRYVKYMRSIRAIQEYLVSRAARHAVPSVNNTNVDRSVATIHATTLGCLRRQARVSASRPGPNRVPGQLRMTGTARRSTRSVITDEKAEKPMWSALWPLYMFLHSTACKRRRMTLPGQWDRRLV